MAQSKPTPGPWEVVPLSGYDGPYAIRMAYVSDNPRASKTYYGVQGIGTEANARLIAEAFTVAHETGLTPRQLAEQREELLAALQWALAEIDGRTSYQRPDQKQACNTKARAAVARAEGGAS